MTKTNKTKLWAATAIAALSLGSGAAMAADQGFYIGGDLAKARQSVDGGALKRNSDSYGVFGGYRFNSNWAVEAAYTDLGKVQGSAIEAKTKTYSLDGIARAPLGKDFGLYGRVGVAHYERDFTGAGDASANGLKLGVGVDYALTQNLALRTELTRYNNLPTSYGLGKSVDRLGVGLSYQF
ncbi:porin family protein [Pelomonas sp. CA6]|uniref:porin family protein n=1 Tax=Pelomonas sp. CA6 TaxID=2907999 RepID=UPI001F4C04EE|nr:porin family protein [Pelomonas sp. CA6]MCH7343507.1 porin family protein [Pelomonas sp. CA6]